jgi:Predicted transcriptional regulator containing an HTH domain and an uncharacterized domain shared with the mammalian protein Schlafen
MPTDIRTESDLESLLGESESMTLEFKGSEDFLVWPQTKEKLRQDLSKEVSAFANTYGGQIVLGIKETREPPRKAESIVGLDGAKPPIETLQRLIENNVRPRLEGVRYHTIRLSGSNEGRVVHVIAVPEGRTAYQAYDKLYYGRSEYECVPLEDQLIRYKMVRDRIAEARVELMDVAVETAESEYASRQAQMAALTAERSRLQTESKENIGRLIAIGKRLAELEGPPKGIDHYAFRLAIRNTGPITILDCSLNIIVEAPFEVALRTGLESASSWSFRFATANKVVVSENPFGGQLRYTQEEKLFPEQILPRSRGRSS